MLGLIPNPKSVSVVSEQLHTLPLKIYCEKEDWRAHAEAFSDAIFKIYDTPFTYGERGGVELLYDGSISLAAYRIDIDADSMRLFASSDEGISYAMATALQICEKDGGELKIPTLKIEDAPDRDYRSLMVDIGREWHPFDKLLKLVDLCFFYKIKYLNAHFCDNKLYTLPSRAFPNLNVHGRYYTEDEIASLRAYARARGVVIIPEFECPGHALILNRHYPEVFSDRVSEDGGAVYNELGLPISSEELLCACRESAVEGVKTLLYEICELFPDSPYIHIGGDEPSIALWGKCSDCQKYMAENGIADVESLFCDYIARIASYVFSLGKTPIVWEGFPKKGSNKIPKDTFVISWENHYQTTEELIEGGFPILNASWKPLYLVAANISPSPRFAWDSEDIFKWDIFNWQHWWEHSKATLTPVHLEPTEQVKGAIFCVWSMTFEQEICPLMARLPAFAERTWTIAHTRDFSGYNAAFHKLFDLTARLEQDK